MLVKFVLWGLDLRGFPIQLPPHRAGGLLVLLFICVNWLLLGACSSPSWLGSKYVILKGLEGVPLDKLPPGVMLGPGSKSDEPLRSISSENVNYG